MLDLECPAELRDAALAALEAAGLKDGHLTVELVSEMKIREFNHRHRERDEPTDVLAFPVDERAQSVGPRELGDVLVCPEQAMDLREATVHGVLHLAGFDHETDEGEMLALQRRVMESLRLEA